MATIKLRDYLLALSSKSGAAGDSDKLTILDSSDGNAIKTILKSDLVDIDYLVSELQDDFLDQFGEGTFSGSTQVDHDSTTNFVANEHIDHTSVSIIAGAGLTGGGDISSDRTINIVSDNNGIVVNADQIELDTDSSTFSGGVLTKMNIEQVVSGSSQISADQTDGWVGDVKTQLNSNTVISGSSQVILNDADKTLFDTADVAEGTNLYYTDVRVKTKLNTEGVFSGSSQVILNDADYTGFDTTDISEGNNLYYTDARVLSKINTEGILSGSTFSSPSQGTLRATINGVNSDVDLGLQSGDNVSFVDGAFTGNLTINGNLNVLGDSAEIQVSELRIEDKLITLASGAADSATSDGAGLEVNGANKSLKWNHPTQQFVFDAKVSSSVGFKGEGGELTGIDTDQVTEAGNLYYTDARVKTKLNTEGVLSGSTQIASDISGSGFVSATNEFEELTLTKGSGETSVLELSPKKVLELVKNKEPQTLAKGTPVYVSGSTGNAANVYAASASREDRMPAAFVLDQQLTSDQEGNGIALGFINGVDTSGFNEGDNVYVGISGGYTNVKPTGNSNKVQKLGNVIKSAVNGSGVITGAGRSNDVPNIQQGYLWVGGPNDVVYQLTTSSLLSGNGVISGSSQIDVTQTTNYGSINQYTDSDNLSYLNSLLVVSKSAGGDLDVDGSLTASGTLISGDLMPNGENLYDIGSAAVRWEDIWADQVYGRSVYVDDNIYHNGDTDTYIAFTADRQTYLAGGDEFIDFREAAESYITLGNSNDTDTRLQGGAGYIFIQGSDGYIGINDASPSYPLEVNANTHIGATLSLSGGDLQITGSLSISGDGSNGATFTESGNGDFDISVVDDLRLTAGGNDIVLKGSGGTEYGRLSNDTQNLIIKNITSDKDISFVGKDDTVDITALTLDMSNGGSATFIDDIDLGGKLTQTGTGDNKFLGTVKISKDATGLQQNLLLSNLNDTNGDATGIAFSMLDNNTYVKGGIYFERTDTQGRGDLVFLNNNEVNGNNASLADADARMKITPAGEVRIGNAYTVNANGLSIEKTGNHIFLRATSATAGEYWNFDVDSNNRLSIINDNNDGVYIDDAATSWTGTSDERLKTINYELTGSLENLEDIRAVNYSWVSGSIDKNFIGLIAQDVEQHYPEMISEDKFGYKGIRYTEMIPVLVSAIKEQQSIIDDLKSRIETLENS